MTDANSLIITPRPLPSPEDARRRKAQELRAAAAAAFAFAKVAALSGGFVQLQTLNGEILGEVFPRVAGVELAVGNLVLVAMVRGQEGDLARVVVGRIDGDPAPAPYDPRPFVQTSYTLGIASNGATVPTNAVVGSYQEANHIDFTLPAGTWDVTVDGSADLSHSSGGGVKMQEKIDAGAPSTEKGMNAPSTGKRQAHSATFSGIAGGPHTAYLLYAPTSAGTASAAQVALTVTAARTA